MMDLNELREVVDFMKENGLCELEYSEKNTSVKLRLAPPPPPDRRRPRFGPAAGDAGFEPVDPEGAENGGDVEELRSAAKSAARKAAQKAADGMETVASYVKSRLSDDEEPSADEVPETPAESVETEAVPEAPVEAPTETAEDEEPSDDASARPLKHAGEAVWNTVKAGAVLGKAGAKRGRERLVSLFRSDRTEEAPADEGEYEVMDDEEKDAQV